MGCSASRPSSFLTNKNHHSDEQNPSHVFDSFDHTSTFSSPQVSKSISLHTPLIHHPPSKKGDSHHLVSLTSTTYGSLLLIDSVNPSSSCFNRRPDDVFSPRKSTFRGDPGEGLSPDSVINTWELMDGLHDDDDDKEFELGHDPLKLRSSISDPSMDSCFRVGSLPHLGSHGSSNAEKEKLHGSCFDSVMKSEDVFAERSLSFSVSKPLWKHLSEESLLSKMDPNVGSSYRRALSSRQLGYKKDHRIVMSVGSSPMNSSKITNGSVTNGKDDKIVVYFTSLRGIRKTYEDCYAVRMIFRGFRVAVDEKDISMDSTYKKELQNLINGKATTSLPQVFIRGEHIGGVEEIRKLHEGGELAKILEGFPFKDPNLVCESCGDARFLPCPNCSGSRKVFDEELERLRRCNDCNENGLIKCPGCSSSSSSSSSS